MSKDITIKEGAQARNFTAKKLRTNLIGGGSCLWVPKDSTNLVTKRINKAGLYEAKYDEAYGYSKVTVTGIASDDDLKVIEKNVTENGSYSARNDNVAGYNIARVKVKGGGTYTDETGKKVTPDPSTSPGSAVVGVNPDTGNEEVEKIDDNGNLKTLELASYIQLDTPPTKMSYRDGERIMMSGAVAHGYKKDGTPYKGTLAASELPWHQYGNSESSEYSEDFLPGGIVFEMPQYAKSEGGVDYDEATVEDTSRLSLTWYDLPAKLSRGGYPAHYSSGGRSSDGTASIDSGYALWSSNIFYAVSTTPISYTIPWEDDGNTTFFGQSEFAPVGTITDVLVPIYYLIKGFGYALNIRDYPTPNANHSITHQAQFVCYDLARMCYGVGSSIKAGGKQTITLTWPREGDRKHLQTTFDIAVTE